MSRRKERLKKSGYCEICGGLLAAHSEEKIQKCLKEAVNDREVAKKKVEKLKQIIRDGKYYVKKEVF